MSKRSLSETADELLRVAAEFNFAIASWPVEDDGVCSEMRIEAAQVVGLAVHMRSGAELLERDQPNVEEDLEPSEELEPDAAGGSLKNTAVFPGSNRGRPRA
jgi:hypothetical protein